MGTAGNREGYKIFCFDTTIRNPIRNQEFLELFKPFDGQLLTDEIALKYYSKLIGHGIYQFRDVPESIKNKWNNNEILTEQEIINAVKENPQACGDTGRVKTQLRALKTQGFLKFVREGQFNRISISPLGNELIGHPENAENIYTKAMIACHSNQPDRTTHYNQARPFLNTLFVIREVKKLWADINPGEAKGILFHEFGAFVLSMKDCNYKQCARDIIEYRKKFRYEVNQQYILEYLHKNDIINYNIRSIIHDYPDEVFRKFNMTGLLVLRGAGHNYCYIDFSKYNIEKLSVILEKYDNYQFENFNTQDAFYQYVQNIDLPWENNERLRKKIIETKAMLLDIPIMNKNNMDDVALIVDRAFATNALNKVVTSTSISEIFEELLILAGQIKKKSNNKYRSIPEPVRLEYLIALAIGKLYGTVGLISNLIYDETGHPIRTAPSGKSDIIYISNDGNYIFEPTMQTGRLQQLNSETTNIVRHIQSEKEKENLTYRVMMVAPRVHIDVVEFFQFEAIHKEVNILPASIKRLVGLFNDSNDIRTLSKNYDEILDILIQTKDVKEYSDAMNAYIANI